jgi:hypothetical protein
MLLPNYDRKNMILEIYDILKNDRSPKNLSKSNVCICLRQPYIDTFCHYEYKSKEFCFAKDSSNEIKRW